MSYKRGTYNNTNNYAELLSLITIISLATKNDATSIHIFSDSLLVVKWMNASTRCANISLKHMLSKGLTWKLIFSSYTIEHTYRENNTKAYLLTKAACELMKSHIQLTKRDAKGQQQNKPTTIANNMKGADKHNASWLTSLSCRVSTNYS